MKAAPPADCCRTGPAGGGVCGAEDEAGRFIRAGILRSGGGCLETKAGEEAGELDVDMGFDEEEDGLGEIFEGGGTKGAGEGEDDEAGDGEEVEDDEDDEFLEFFSRLPSPKRAK